MVEYCLILLLFHNYFMVLYDGFSLCDIINIVNPCQRKPIEYILASCQRGSLNRSIDPDMSIYLNGD
jgi:hypothetical protein